jgi:amino acid transporter
MKIFFSIASLISIIAIYSSYNLIAKGLEILEKYKKLGKSEEFASFLMVVGFAQLLLFMYFFIVSLVMAIREFRR